jgi:hypothetical protein
MLVKGPKSVNGIACSSQETPPSAEVNASLSPSYPKGPRATHTPSEGQEIAESCPDPDGSTAADHDVPPSTVATTPVPTATQLTLLAHETPVSPAVPLGAVSAVQEVPPSVVTTTSVPPTATQSRLEVHEMDIRLAMPEGGV